MVVRVVIAAVMSLCAWGVAGAQPPGSPEPAAREGGIEALVSRFDAVYSEAKSSEADRRRVLVALRDALKSTTPAPISGREKDLIGQRSANNELVKRTLVGHYVIVLATEKFAARAEENGFVAVMDLGYLCLKHFWGNDAMARAGNRFIFYPDPNKPGGHTCFALANQVAIGRADADNADWFERFFHEMTHGFQRDHPAGCCMESGFFEGFAEFCQAVVCEYLAPLGAPFEGRFGWYSKHFPESAAVEYLQTRLPIEEIVAYDPAAGLLMELTNTTLDPRGRPDWTPLRALLQGPIREPRWAPWHLWPAQMARDCERHFGAAKARPVLAKYRFPLDAAAFAEVGRATRPKPQPWPNPRVAVVEWRVLGPVANPRGMGLDWNPLDVENLALDAAQEKAMLSLPAAAGLSWRSDVRCDAGGLLHLRDDRGKESEFYYVVGSLAEDQRGPLTLFVSSDDEVALYVDGRLVHLFRGSRACTPEYPDVAYAMVDGLGAEGAGRIVALVVNHGGPAAFSLAVAKGTPFESAYAARLAGPDPAEGCAMVEYLGSRRFVAPLKRPLLLKALEAADAGVRGAAARALGGVRNDAGVVEALYARIGVEKDGVVRGAVLDAIDELTFRRPIPEIAAQTWRDDRARFAGSDDAEAELAWRLGTINAGFFGNNAGACGAQCVDRGWGGDASHFLNVVVEAHEPGVHAVRFRYAHPADEGKLTVRLRRGVKTVVESRVTLARTQDWASWRWCEVETPRLEAGRYYVELVEPRCTPVIDVVGMERR